MVSYLWIRSTIPPRTEFWITKLSARTTTRGMRVNKTRIF
jgi:hypothetical protein